MRGTPTQQLRWSLRQQGFWGFMNSLIFFSEPLGFGSKRARLLIRRKQNKHEDQMLNGSIGGYARERAQHPAVCPSIKSTLQGKHEGSWFDLSSISPLNLLD